MNFQPISSERLRPINDKMRVLNESKPASATDEETKALVVK